MREEKLLEKLTQLWGVAGFEKEVRKAIEEEVSAYADEMITDAIGNLIVLKKGKGGANSKKIMFAA
ncbi:MAG: M42 family peptidase, partial [Frisingicoccus sp.]|nr:M42 family peptidase [Frisingicoccus sp.]